MEAKASLEKSIGENKVKIDLLVNAMVRHEALIGELASKAENVELRSMKQNLIITGIQEEDKESCGAKIDSFFKNKLELTQVPAVKVAHRVGEGQNRPMVVRLKSARDKGVIYKNVSNLKEKKNAEDKAYFVNDQLPARMNEQKIWEKQVFKKYKSSVAHQLTLSFKRGKLMVNGEEFKQKITAPSERQILQADEKEIIEWRKWKCVEGREIRKYNCTFRGYTRAVSTHQEIRNAYCLLKMVHGSARHIVCIYRLPGVLPTDEGYEDDGEFFAGRKLLRLMENAQIQNRVFFVVRYYRGCHIGKARYQGYREAIEAALLGDSANQVTGQIDSFKNGTFSQSSTRGGRGGHNSGYSGTGQGRQRTDSVR